eukprot:TRINITY_DN16164_c0_g1_i2.p1 TRINITY_DN16164_c0_g1~~TRINITY_DN16164_c0_g1_i2.p1  ORF type:complete len:259 (+),score=34.89 TRINITY_DN16164_c0_g1_i2:56-832(+)
MLAKLIFGRWFYNTKDLIWLAPRKYTKKYGPAVVLSFYLWRRYLANEKMDELYTPVFIKDGYQIRDYNEHPVYQTQFTLETGEVEEAFKKAKNRFIPFLTGGNNNYVFVRVKPPAVVMEYPLPRQVRPPPALTIPGWHQIKKVPSTPEYKEVKEDPTWVSYLVADSHVNAIRLPRAHDPHIQAVDVKPAVVAAKPFSGWITNQRVKELKEQFKKELERDGVKAVGPFMVADYNRRYDFFFRRNELLVEIADVDYESVK